MKVALVMLILCMFLYLNLEMATNTHLPESMSVSGFTNYLESKGMWAGTLERVRIGAAAGARCGRQCGRQCGRKCGRSRC